MSANRVVEEGNIEEEKGVEQLNLFTNYKTVDKEKEEEEAELVKERKMQETILELKKKFGKNAVLKGVNLEEGATTLDRNKRIGGHKA